MHWIRIFVASDLPSAPVSESVAYDIFEDLFSNIKTKFFLEQDRATPGRKVIAGATKSIQLTLI
jgi:hypothetical protein